MTSAAAGSSRTTVGMWRSSQTIRSRRSRFRCIVSWTAGEIASVRAKRSEKIRTSAGGASSTTRRAASPWRIAIATAAPPSEWPTSPSIGPHRLRHVAPARGRTPAGRRTGRWTRRAPARRTPRPGSPASTSARRQRADPARAASPAVHQHHGRPLAPLPAGELLALARDREARAGGDERLVARRAGGAACRTASRPSARRRAGATAPTVRNAVRIAQSRGEGRAIAGGAIGCAVRGGDRLASSPPSRSS